MFPVKVDQTIFQLKLNTNYHNRINTVKLFTFQIMSQVLCSQEKSHYINGSYPVLHWPIALWFVPR